MAAIDHEGGYEWDLFVSYKRDPAGQHLIAPWVSRVIETVRYWLTQARGGDPARVFFDTEAIEVGTQWRAELRRALLRSRCLMAVLSPEYFRSEWCLTEWSSFLARQRMLSGHPVTVILPVKFCDGSFFPLEAQDMEQLDLSDHSSLMPAFWESPGALELERKLKPFAMRLAAAIDAAPDFQVWPFESPPPSPAPVNVPMRRL